MQTALRLEATVLPGHRLEISAPELLEGAKVEVIVVLPEKQQPQRMSMLEFVESLPPVLVTSRLGKNTSGTFRRSAIRGIANWLV